MHGFQYLLLGAVPFPKDVPRLKQLGVGGVITLNEAYETLVPSSLYYVGYFSIQYVYFGYHFIQMLLFKTDSSRALAFLFRFLK